MDQSARIFVAGGIDARRSSLCWNGSAPTASRRVVGAAPDEPDLTDAGRVDAFFAGHVRNTCSSRPGNPGASAPTSDRPADLMLDNLLVAAT